MKLIFNGIRNIRLHAFRCYREAKIDLGTPSLVYIYGANSSGKTTILDAVGVFTDVKYTAVSNENLLCWNQSEKQWVLSLSLSAFGQEYAIKCCFDAESFSTSYFLNNNRVALNEIQRRFSAISMNPKLFRSLIDHTAQRRYWLDKWVDMHDENHYDRCLSYRKLTQNRLKLLQGSGGKSHDAWLSAIENRLGDLIVAISTQRLYWVEIINNQLQAWAARGLPLINVDLVGQVENYMRSNRDTAEIERYVKEHLQKNRALDQEKYSNHLGPGCSKIQITTNGKTMHSVSHGQQKFAILLITAAHAACLHQQHGKLSLLLLDEMFAHLDEISTEQLWDVYEELQNQIWITELKKPNLKGRFANRVQIVHTKYCTSKSDTNITFEHDSCLK